MIAFTLSSATLFHFKSVLFSSFVFFKNKTCKFVKLSKEYITIILGRAILQVTRMPVSMQLGPLQRQLIFHLKGYKTENEHKKCFSLFPRHSLKER